MARTDEFRTSALHFKEFGTYCKFPKGSRTYIKFWDEEIRRSLEGYHAGHDYIPGYMYFYLNYSPIQIVTPRKDSKGIIIYNADGTVQGDRTESLPEWWDGDYNYFHYLNEAEKAGKHGIVLKARGKGYSFKGASMLNRNYFLVRNSKSYAIASEKEFLIKDGLLTKAWEMMSFIDSNTAWSKRRQVADVPMHKRASYKISVNGVEAEKGFLSEIIGISTKNDVQKIRGKRGKLVLMEEGGNFPMLTQAWNIFRDSMEQGNVVQGLMVAYGTGGTEGADFSGMAELFDNPKGYNILPVNNTWDEGKENSQCGFFVPDYMNLEGFMDKEGNSDIPKALKYIEEDRKKTLEFTKDSLAYKRRCAEHPITTREAMMSLEGNIFPTKDLLGVLGRLETDPQYEKSLTKGKFIIDDNGRPDFIEDTKARIIYNFPVRKEDHLDAPGIIYEHPFKNGEEVTPYGMYVGAIDSYDLTTGTSLGSFFIVNKVTNRIVFEYTGRTGDPKDFYEQCRRALMYYNAQALYENGNIGIFTYFEGQGSTHLLYQEPTLIKEIIKNPGQSRVYGVRMTKEVKRHAETLLYQWLVKDYDEKLNLKVYHKIRSQGLLKELCAYNQNINCDRVSAMFCLVLQLEEERKYIPKEEQKIIPISQRGIFGREWKSNSFLPRTNIN